MRILVDTREQRPLKFTPSGALTEVQYVMLPVGDYAAEYLDGSRCPVYFERKSLTDLWGTMTTGYARFKREMELAKAREIKLVLAIEGTIQNILAGCDYSQYAGESMIRKLMTLWLKYDLMPLFCGTREDMAYVIREFFESFGRNYKVRKV